MMILGMTAPTFVHVAISLIGILSGFMVLYELLAGKRLDGWSALFLITTVGTSVTGFLFFPLQPLLPSHGVGALSLIVLASAIYAFYARRLAGSWRWIYIAGAVAALYLNVFVAIVQAFLKIPALPVLAPTQAEPPFVIAQVSVIVLFVVLGLLAVKRFRGMEARGA